MPILRFNFSRFAGAKFPILLSLLCMRISARLRFDFFGVGIGLEVEFERSLTYKQVNWYDATSVLLSASQVYDFGQNSLWRIQRRVHLDR